MPEYNNNILCLTYSEITDGFISESNYKIMVHRNKLKVIRRGCYGTPALIELNSLPTKIKDAVKIKYPEIENTAKQSTLIGLYQTDPKASLFFAEYLLS